MKDLKKSFVVAEELEIRNNTYMHIYYYLPRFTKTLLGLSPKEIKNSFRLLKIYKDIRDSWKEYLIKLREVNQNISDEILNMLIEIEEVEVFPNV